MIVYVLPEEPTDRALTITSDFVKKTFYGVDCEVPCENWPEREALESLLASDSDTLHKLKEVAMFLDVVVSKSKCAGKTMLDVGHASVNDLRPIGELLRQLEEESGMDIPCILRNL